MPATEKFARDLKKVHVIFAVSSLALFVSTIWMMAADHSDEWRGIQTTFDEIQTLRLQRGEKLLKQQKSQALGTADGFEKRVLELQNELTAAKAAVAKQQKGIAESERAVGQANRDVRGVRANRDVARADYDLAISTEKGPDVLADLMKKFEIEQRKTEAAELDLQQKEQTFERESDAFADDVSKRDAFQAELDELNGEVERLHAALQKIRPDDWLSRGKRKMMEWPIIDGFNSHHKIYQDWLPEMKITLGMVRTARFDRCRTCHLAIDLTADDGGPAYPFGKTEKASVADWVANNKYPHPYATHPNPAVYLTAASPHPTPKFGCTICHDGNGAGTSFQNGEHTPNNPHLGHEWNKEYQWRSNHFWEYPMQPKRFVESSCIKCHHSVTELGVHPQFGATAPKVYQGYLLLKKFGCFGCHQIHGYDAGKPIGPDLRLEPATAEDAARIAADPNLIAGKMRKVGPALTHIAAKTSQEWIAHWTEEPKRFRPTTRMPQFFKLTNQLDTEKLEHGEIDLGHVKLDDLDPTSKAFSPVEIAGMAAYLIDKSQPIDLDQPEEQYRPNPSRGKVLFAKRGCLACHSHEAFPTSTADFGPELSKVHQKIKPPANNQPLVDSEGFRWVYTWIRDPTRHHPRTKMPNLFLETYVEVVKQGDQDVTQGVDPAADIAAFLLEKGAGTYPASEFTPYLGAEFDDIDAATAKQLRLDPPRGVLVRAVVPGSPATRTTVTKEQNGEDVSVDLPLEPGDVVLAFNGITIGSAEDLSKQIATAEIGRPVSLSVWRRGKPFRIRIVVDEPLNDLIRLLLSKVLKKQEVEKFLNDENHKYPTPAELIKGDEIELAADGSDWRRKRLNYVGRRTISRYGCYGCHDIPGFQTARPIGTTLQDWGRKDTTKLAVDHIAEFLHHHGEADGSSTLGRVNRAMKLARAGGFEAGEFKTKTDEDRQMAAAFFYDSLLHHGRPGFIWQKLRQPRSYDFKKIETKGYDERLRMPRFTFSPDTSENEEAIEAIATFVLGLVAEPPAEQYVYTPKRREADRIEGERLLEKYNCASCHMLELPEIAYGLPIKNPEKPQPVRDLVGMTADDLIDWFVENRQAIVAGEIAAGDLPDGVALMGRFGALGEIAKLLEKFQEPEPRVRKELETWFSEHKEYLFAADLKRNEGEFAGFPVGNGEYVGGSRHLVKLKPPVNGETGKTLPSGEPVIRFRGLVNTLPDFEEEFREDQIYSYQLWETLEVGGKLLRPGRLMSFHDLQLAESRKPESKPPRGGQFAQWLVGLLASDRSNVKIGGKRTSAWQMVPPPLYLEGIKVQTPWLYRFLKNPHTVRHETVLRMPRFNMSDEEARALANYFAAVDGAAYPYQQVPQHEPEYVTRTRQSMNQVLERKFENNSQYLGEAWQLLSKNTLCIGCHAVGGRKFQAGPDPTKFTHGPDLKGVANRLRPEWVTLWLSNPAWVTPYTGMVIPGSKTTPDLFRGQTEPQTIGLQMMALRDALMNYHRLAEDELSKHVKPLKSAVAADDRRTD